MTSIRWTRAAAGDLEHIALYLQEHRPALAQPTTIRLYQAAASLANFPNRGRVGRLAGTRELTAPPLPFVIIYTVAAGVVSIARVLHGAQSWPPQ